MFESLCFVWPLCAVLCALYYEQFIIHNSILMSDHISREEFRKALWKLRTGGTFSNHEIDEVENVFRGDMHEGGSSAGISKEELKQGLHYLKHHPENHHLSPHEINKLEEAMRHYL